MKNIILVALIGVALLFGCASQNTTSKEINCEFPFSTQCKLTLPDEKINNQITVDESTIIFPGSDQERLSVTITAENNGENVQTFWIGDATGKYGIDGLHDYDSAFMDDKGTPCIFTINPSSKKTFRCVSDRINRPGRTQAWSQSVDGFDFKLNLWSKDPCIHYTYTLAINNGGSYSNVKKYGSCQAN